jgi:hypothetical protein
MTDLYDQMREAPDPRLADALRARLHARLDGELMQLDDPIGPAPSSTGRDAIQHRIDEPDITEPADTTEPTMDVITLSPDRNKPPTTSRRWLMVAAAALALVGGLIFAGTRADEEPIPADQPEPTLSYQWSRVTHDEGVLGGDGDQRMNSVTAGGPGLVAVGSAVWTSVDGLTWSRVPDDEAIFAAASIYGVTAGGPGLVAVGDAGGDAAVWTSVDGVKWVRVAHDEAVFGGTGVQEMKAVTAGGPGLVAVGWDGPREEHSVNSADAAVWTSVDGVTWVRVAHDEEIFGGDRGREMRSVAVGGPGLVAVGREHFPAADHNAEVAAVWTSFDGVTWARVAHDDEVFGGTGVQEMNSVVAAGPGLVAVGLDERLDDSREGLTTAAVWTSVDGIAWERVPYDEQVEFKGFAGDKAMISVTATDAGLVAVGFDGGGYGSRSDATVWTSVDGVSWTRLANDDGLFGGARMYGVTPFGTGVVAVGRDWLAEDREYNNSVVWRATPQR